MAKHIWGHNVNSPLKIANQFCIFGVLLRAASVSHRSKSHNRHTPPYGVSFFVTYSINHHLKAVVASRAKTLTLVVVCQRCELPTIAFFIGQN